MIDGLYSDVSFHMYWFSQETEVWIESGMYERVNLQVANGSTTSAKCIYVSASVWKLSDQNPRVDKFQSILDRWSGLPVHLGPTAKYLSAHRRSGDNQQNIWKHQRPVWKRQWQACEHLEALATILGVPMTNQVAPTTNLALSGANWERR